MHIDTPEGLPLTYVLKLSLSLIHTYTPSLSLQTLPTSVVRKWRAAIHKRVNVSIPFEAVQAHCLDKVVIAP